MRITRPGGRRLPKLAAAGSPAEPPTPAALPEPEEAPRPHPAANAWPDDAVTVTYAELRRLIALHLELAARSMPGAEPWAWMKLRAGAVRDGEVPLLLSEVMEP